MNMSEEHNGVALANVLEALDRDDAKEGRRLLRMWMCDEPLPCPCCNGGSIIVERGDNAVIICDECGMSSPVGELADIMKIWNRRYYADKTE